MTESSICLLWHEKRCRFIKGCEKNDLYANETLSMALLYALLIIGEAAAAISHDFKDKHKSVPWKKIIGMRNWLIHGYFKTEFDIVWDTVTIDIPDLIEYLEEII